MLHWFGCLQVFGVVKTDTSHNILTEDASHSEYMLSHIHGDGLYFIATPLIK